jgi:hypothetical protein
MAEPKGIGQGQRSCPHSITTAQTERHHHPAEALGEPRQDILGAFGPALNYTHERTAECWFLRNIEKK